MAIDVKIKLDEGVNEPIQYGEWIDLFTAEETVMKAGENKKISLGVRMELPDGYYAIFSPRSSTFQKYGILQTNGITIIENDYCGEKDVWLFSAYATRDTVIPKNVRICQFQLFKQHDDVTFHHVDKMLRASRNGFGSTGI